MLAGSSWIAYPIGLHPERVLPLPPLSPNFRCCLRALYKLSEYNTVWYPIGLRPEWGSSPTPSSNFRCCHRAYTIEYNTILYKIQRTPLYWLWLLSQTGLNSSRFSSTKLHTISTKYDIYLYLTFELVVKDEDETHTSKILDTRRLPLSC